MEEFGERVIKVIDGSFSDSQYISINVDEGELTIYGILHHQTKRIRSFVRKIEIMASEKGKNDVIATLYLQGLGQFSAKMERALYQRIEAIISET